MRYRLLLVVLSVIGTISILIFTKHYGAGLSPDSVSYISTARNIATGIDIVTYDGAPLLFHPPLYPLLLATVDYIFGVDPLSSANIVNAVLFGFIVYLAGTLFLEHLKSSTLLALFGAVSVLVANPLIQVSLMAWSEPLFICFMLFYLIYSERYLKKGDTSSLLLLSMSVSLMCLTRYIGVIFILIGVVSILFFRRDSLRLKIGHLLLFMSVATLPIGMWTIRNYLLSGTLFGPRASSIFTLFQNLSFAFDTLLSWYIPRRISVHRSILMLLSGTIGFLAGLNIRGDWSKLKTLLSEIGPLLLVIIVYVGFLVVSSTTTAYDQIDNRLLSPIFVPTTLLLLSLAFRMLQSLTQQWSLLKRVNILLPVAIIGIYLLIFPTKATILSITNAMSQGQGYSSESWRNSQTVQYLLRHHTIASKWVIYTNGPDVLYILANLTAKWSPRRARYNFPEIVNDISSLNGYWPQENNSYIIWFDKIDRTYLFTVDELRTVANIQQIIRLKDGAIYSVERKSS